MRKLTRLDTRQFLSDILDTDPADFEVMLKEYLPSDIMDELIRSNMEAAIKRYPHDNIDRQTSIAAFGLAGFQLGWLLAMEVMKDGR